MARQAETRYPVPEGPAPGPARRSGRILDQLERLVSRIGAAGSGGRRALIAIAGPPGAGKSLLSQRLCRMLPSGSAEVLPMDGFHYDNAVLDQLGLRHRKGAPETFDFDGFEATLERVRDSRLPVAVPVFDRDIDLARAGGRLIGAATRHVLVEGNYLLLDRAPWSRLRPLFDLTIFIEVPRAELERRLVRRWLDLGRDAAAARAWVEQSDMNNVDLVAASRLAADLVWSEDMRQDTP